MLRKKFPRFVFDDLVINREHQGLSVVFTFLVGGKHVFRPSLFFRGEQFRTENMSDAACHAMAFHIGLVEMISYWKAFCSPSILIMPYKLDSMQQAWWKKLFYRGLGEFLHTNGICISQEDFLEFSFANTAAELPSPFNGTAREPSVIIPLGGGKDSAVSLELLRAEPMRIFALSVNPVAATYRIMQASGIDIDRLIIIDRKIDPYLLQLNQEGFLNGHTPFSALLAFVSAFAAYPLEVQDIALSNESSANEPSIPQTGVNHQYSKSYEFEKDFRDYYTRYLNRDLNYFSLLRPLNELQISRIFSDMKVYHQAFRSCNAGSKTDTWCCNCPKCLFTYIILSPFLSREALYGIFGEDIMNKPFLSGFLDQLSGYSENKPLECVGTVTEVNAALKHLLHNMEAAHETLPALLDRYGTQSSGMLESTETVSTLLSSFNNDHQLKPHYNRIIKQQVHRIDKTYSNTC